MGNLKSNDNYSSNTTLYIYLVNNVFCSFMTENSSIKSGEKYFSKTPRKLFIPRNMLVHDTYKTFADNATLSSEFLFRIIKMEMWQIVIQMAISENLKKIQNG